ncbi:MAG: M28 family peptidase [Sphingosinicella sp.]|nr:M28 family peptidase [Sphingosinicella sp.]
MNRLICALLCVSAFVLHSAACSAAQVADSAAERMAVSVRERALRGTVAYSFVEEITARFGPRPAGSPAERKAGEWIADEWRKFGFGNVRVEPFRLAVWSRNRDHGSIVAPFGQPLAVAALGGSPATGAAGVEGDVVLFNTLDDLQAAAANSLRGKVAMLNYRMPRTQSGIGYGLATAGRSQGPTMAAKAGAIAFIMRSAGTDNERYPHAGLTRYAGRSAPLPSFALSAIDANQIERLATRGSVRVRLASAATLDMSGQSQNVVAEIAGSELPQEIVIIGAHLDSWDLGTGAVDDAAGIGIVTAVAKLILDSPRRPKRTLRIVLFGAEEASQPTDPFGLFGAHAYATRYKSEITRHVIGSESDLGSGRIFGLDLPDGFAASDFGAQVSRVLLPLGVLVELEVPPHGGADLLPLQAAGMPVFLLKQDATTYFDLHHTAADTFDKIDRKDLEQNVAAWSALLWLIADSEINFRAPPATLAR